jgi:hypothetical protein
VINRLGGLDFPRRGSSTWRNCDTYTWTAPNRGLGRFLTPQQFNDSLDRDHLIGVE